MIDVGPSFGYRTVAGLVGMNKNGAADLPAQGLAGAQAGGGQPPTDPSFAIGGDSPRPTLGHGPVPDLGWSRRLADAGPGDRLSHTAAAALAAVAQRQGQHRGRGPGAGPDCPSRPTEIGRASCRERVSQYF